MNAPHTPKNPDEFVITRRRKQYKFALFYNDARCYEHDEWDTSFEPTMVELGAGTAKFSVETARRHPDERIVAVDVKADRLVAGARESANVSNVRFLRTRADLLTEIIPEHSLSKLWLTFPDPFPRSRSARRRMTHPYFLGMYAKVLRTDGSFYLKHDNPDFFAWSLEQLVEQGWTIRELSFDLHESQLDDDYKIMTSYETCWLGEQRKTHFVRATPPS